VRREGLFICRNGQGLNLWRDLVIDYARQVEID